MKNGRFAASVAAAIVASGSLLAGGGAAASAATSLPAAAPAIVDFINVNGCEIEYVLNEDHDSSGAYVVVGIISTPCSAGVEAGIKGPSGTPASWGNDIHSNGQASTTGHIPINSGNHHGLRAWNGVTWQYKWED